MDIEYIESVLRRTYSSNDKQPNKSSVYFWHKSDKLTKEWIRIREEDTIRWNGMEQNVQNRILQIDSGIYWNLFDRGNSTSQSERDGLFKRCYLVHWIEKNKVETLLLTYKDDFQMDKRPAYTKLSHNRCDYMNIKFYSVKDTIDNIHTWWPFGRTYILC